MLDRVSVGDVPKKPHLRVLRADGRPLYEECITRAGFEGPYSILYHEHRPHEATPFAPTTCFHARRAEPARELLRRHYRCLALAAGGPTKGALEARIPLLFNADVGIGFASPTAADPAYFVNADADELFFVLQGSGTLRSAFGDLSYEPLDYLYVPKGVAHRFLPAPGTEQALLWLEFRGPLGLPARYRNSIGQLRMDAPFSHRDFRRPVPRGPRDEGLRETLVKRDDTLFGFRSRHSPLDVVGWDGTLYPFALPILAFQPRVGQVHLPPPAHATFEAPGALVCSFVPRPLDFHEQANPCPYPHSSVDVDEVLFYANGAFASRRGIAAGSLSHHPAGIPHGPHPGAYETAPPAGRTDEIAVMLDCAAPLSRTDHAARVEDAEYHRSFEAP
jgi:homogentisate 1,2-dioxygenase